MAVTLRVFVGDASWMTERCAVPPFIGFIDAEDWNSDSPCAFAHEAPRSLERSAISSSIRTPPPHTPVKRARRPGSCAVPPVICSIDV